MRQRGGCHATQPHVSLRQAGLKLSAPLLHRVDRLHLHMCPAVSCPQSSLVRAYIERRGSRRVDPAGVDIVIAHLCPGESQSNRRGPGNTSSHIHTAAGVRKRNRANMAVRAGALTSPVAGLAQYGRAPHEHSRGRHSPASVQGALTFPAAGRRLLPSAALRCSRSDSRRAPEAEACWRAAAPATPWGGCSRLAITCGAGIAQPGEVSCC